jgi:hypothetical protein
MLAMLGMMLVGTAAPADSGYVLAASQQPSGQLDVDVDIGQGGGGGFWADPVWIAVGAIAIVLLVVIVAMAARGGGTTVIKE